MPPHLAGDPAITDPRNPLPQTTPVRMPQLKALTSVRAFAALYVAAYHMVRPFSLWGPLAVFASAGYTGVSFFFLLSGFILTYTHGLEYAEGRGDARRFWVARLARVYPVYLLVTLSSGVQGWQNFHPRIHALAFVADLFMVQSWSVRMVSFFNVVAWSLSVEAFFYLVFPFVVLRLRPRSMRHGLLIFAGCFALVLLVASVAFLVDPEAAWSETTRYSGGHTFVFMLRRYPILQLPEFLCGIALGWIYLQRPVSRSFGRFAAWFGLLTLGLALFWSDRLPFLLLHNGLLIPLYALLVIGLCTRNGLSRALSAAPLLLLGEASYSFYLVHFNFNEFAMQYLRWPPDLPGLALRMAVLVPLCIGLHLCVERPARRWILQWWAGRQARVTEPLKQAA